MLLAVELLCGWQSFNFCGYSLIPSLTLVLTLVNKKKCTAGPAGLSAIGHKHPQSLQTIVAASSGSLQTSPERPVCIVTRTLAVFSFYFFFLMRWWAKIFSFSSSATKNSLMKLHNSLVLIEAN